MAEGVKAAGLKGGPGGAYEVSRTHLHGALTPAQRAFTLSETLDHPALEGRVRVLEGEPVTFEAE